MKRLSGLCVLFLMAASFLHAVDSKADQAAIRALIVSEQGKYIDNGVFWSGAYKRPIVGHQEGEEFPSDAFGKRCNMKLGPVDVQQIEVASSGDLAYEFSYGSLEYDLNGTTPEHLSVKSGMLRVWKKVNGEWTIAAFFVRPLDIPFKDSTQGASK